jgi:hypothetical protein
MKCYKSGLFSLKYLAKNSGKYRRILRLGPEQYHSAVTLPAIKTWYSNKFHAEFDAFVLNFDRELNGSYDL